jgi:hypothetical protein
MDDKQKELLEKEAVLNFLGSTYGELKKLDGDLIAPSSTLAPRSADAKRNIESFINTEKAALQQQTPVHAPPPPPPVVEPVQPVLLAQPQIEVQQIDDNQMSFNFDINEKDELFSLLEKVLSRLDKLHRKVDEISDSIKNNNVTSLPIKKTAKKKSVKKEEK